MLTLSHDAGDLLALLVAATHHEEHTTHRTHKDVPLLTGSINIGAFSTLEDIVLLHVPLLLHPTKQDNTANDAMPTACQPSLHARTSACMSS